MSKINEMICPRCGLRCFTPDAYVTCDGCQTMFYAGESAKSFYQGPTTPTAPKITINGINFDQWDGGRGGN